MPKNDIFNRRFKANHGQAIDIKNNLKRVTCNNANPFTYKGTNTYIVGANELAIIDPGPLCEEHFSSLINAIDGKPVSHIFITHTHIDHSPLAQKLKSTTDAKIVGAAPHFPSRKLHMGETSALDASTDHNYLPDYVMADGDVIEGDDWALQAISTPGHTANHLAFCLKKDGIVFSGDHIMAWATSIVAPPDGSMSAYMNSLDKMLARDDQLYLPGHGDVINKPNVFVRGLKNHRKMRERAIMERLSKGDETIANIVEEIYRDTDPRLYGAAQLSVFAHLEHLIEQGRIICENTPSLKARYIIKR